MKNLLWCFLTLFALSSTAQALELTVMGGANYAAPTQRTSGIDIHQTGNATATFGAFASIPLFSSAFELEVGIVSLAQQSERDNVMPFVTQKMQFVQVPVMIRYHLDESIGLGVGAYTAFAQGNVQTTQNGFTTETSYDNLLLNKTDSGLLLNLRARFAVAPPLFIVLDARYQHGLTNMARIQNDLLNTRSIQAMAGLSYRFSTTKEKTSDRFQIIENE